MFHKADQIFSKLELFLDSAPLRIKSWGYSRTSASLKNTVLGILDLLKNHFRPYVALYS